jgi:predicted CoA-binding protein
VVPVNPKEQNIEWLKTHKLLSTVPKSFEIFNFVVPPKVTLQILKKHQKFLQNKKVWIQPWAEDEEVEKFLQENNFTDYTTKSCIMIEDIAK